MRTAKSGSQHRATGSFPSSQASALPALTSSRQSKGQQSALTKDRLRHQLLQSSRVQLPDDSREHLPH